MRARSFLLLCAALTRMRAPQPPTTCACAVFCSAACHAPQAVTRGDFVHHTSFLWDLDPAHMKLLLQPEKQPGTLCHTLGPNDDIWCHPLLYWRSSFLVNLLGCF